MNTSTITQQLTLAPNDPHRLAKLCGQFDIHTKQIETSLGIEIKNRGNAFQLTGPENHVEAASNLLKRLYKDTDSDTEITPESLHIQLIELNTSLTEHPQPNLQPHSDIIQDLSVATRKGQVKPRGDNQKDYVRNIFRHDINFGIGPAGTGKTYLAVACAVNALEAEEVRRILLVRPAVEAGEKLGFLPGDLAEKINPYLRPLYDALYEMLGFERVSKLIERQVIEVAPLAYMRGRTLNHAFIILDESQNTTPEQMKMFLTRIGFNAQAVITGDITQVDLPRGVRSGLRHAIDVLDDIPGISFNYFESKDVVRHPVVARIVDAYDAFEKKEKRLKEVKNSHISNDITDKNT